MPAHGGADIGAERPGAAAATGPLWAKFWHQRHIISTRCTGDLCCFMFYMFYYSALWEPVPGYQALWAA